ncbi:MAG: hypothetical protein JWO92_157 [Chitinophagaceae bacterium]|nr:hypothetical protein [Chitinophagaceae bacterium]
MKYLKITPGKVCLFFVLLLSGIVVNAQSGQLDKLFMESSEAFGKGNYEQALLPLQQVLNIEPNSLQALNEISSVYGKLKNYQAAVYSCKQLITLQPDNANHWNNTGWFLMLNKEYTEAEKYYLHALTLNDCSYSIYLNLGHVYGFLKQKSKCLEFYKKAASYIPNSNAYEKGILPDFDLLEREGNFPYRTAPYKNMFVNYFTTQYLSKAYGSDILDSIFQLTTFKNYSVYDESITALKEKFLKEEIKNEHRRLYVMRDFFWSLGWLHYNRDSKLIAMEKYFVNVIEISNDLKDTSFIIDVLYKMGNANEGGVFLMKQAVNLAILSNNVDKQYTINLLLGDKMREKNKEDSALYYFRKSFYLADIVAVPSAKNVSINRLMLVFGEMKLIDSVSYYYALSKTINAGNVVSLEDQFIDDLVYCSLLRTSGKPAESVLKGKGFIQLYKNEKSINVSDIYEKVGFAYYQLSQQDSAVVYFREAIRLYVTYIKNNPKVDHEFPLKERSQSFIYLKRMALEKKNINELFDLSEQSKANILYPTLTGNKYPAKSISISAVAKELKDDEVVISYSNSYMANVGFGIAISKDANLLIEEDHTLLDKLMKGHSEVAWDEVLYKVRAASQANQSTFEPGEFRTGITLLGIIGTNLNNMMQGGNTRGIITETSQSSNYKAEMLAFNDVLYQIYIKPFEKLLTGKKTIYISADAGTTLIAFETLKNDKDEYLGDLYNIIYVPSLTSRAILKSAAKPGTKRMLALGNPVYTSFQPHNMTGRAYDLSRSGLDNWNDLPGTANELTSIKKDVPSAMVIDKNHLTESRVKALSNSGELAAYDILHFAVHGMVSMSDYRDNALIISEKIGTSEDGFLQFNEIANLHLNAGLVCLSACETAAGIPGDGEEVKNLPIAFFLAGAKSVIATWWKINDEVTGIFMSSFYKLVFKENRSYSEALHLTRQKFIKGEFGEKYKAPYYWAAFKYFGY